MTRLIYTDFDEFADSLLGIEGHFIPTARQTDEWWIKQADGSRSWLQAFQTGGPTTFAGQGKSGTFTVAALITQSSHLRINGQPLKPDEFMLLHESQPFTVASQDAVRWIAITLPTDTPLIASELILKRWSSPPRIRTPPTYLDRLRRIASQLIFPDERIELNGPVAALSTEEELALCLTHALEHGAEALSHHNITRPPVSRTRIIAQTLALIDGHQGEPLFVADLCHATQVSERTLRNIFCEYFGVGPMRLLKALQLYNIRIALLRADPQHDTVTCIAGRFGIWDFSLFARNYKAMFGELPSKALQAEPTEARNNRSRVGWLQYALRLARGVRS